jgi:hypothetical protein
MKFIWVPAILALSVFGFGHQACADTIHLKRGGAVQGEVVESGSTVEVRMQGGTVTFNKEEITRIEKNEHGTGPWSPPVRPAAGAKNTAGTARSQAARAATAVKKRPVVRTRPTPQSSDSTREKSVGEIIGSTRENIKKLNERNKTLLEGL